MDPLPSTLPPDTLILTLNRTQTGRGELLGYAICLMRRTDEAASLCVELVGLEQIRPPLLIGSKQEASPPREHQTYRHIQRVAGHPPGTKAASACYSGMLHIPAAGQPTYRGVAARHIWLVRAFIEAPDATLWAEAELLVV